MSGVVSARETNPKISIEVSWWETRRRAERVALDHSLFVFLVLRGGRLDWPFQNYRGRWCNGAPLTGDLFGTTVRAARLGRCGAGRTLGESPSRSLGRLRHAAAPSSILPGLWIPVGPFTRHCVYRD